MAPPCDSDYTTSWKPSLLQPQQKKHMLLWARLGAVNNLCEGGGNLMGISWVMVILGQEYDLTN